MKQFEVGKSYRTENRETYTVTKRTDAFVTFTSASGTKKFRRKPCCHSEGYEWVEVPGYGGWRLCAHEVEAPVSQVATLISQPEETQKERKTMKRITSEQAVRAVQSATTAEEVQAVLEQCKKEQLNEVFLAVTGTENDLCPKSWKKAELVSQYTARTVAFKAREAFKEMDAEARAEYLVSGKFQQDNNTVDKLTWNLSPYELITLNAALGVSFEEYKDIREGHSAIASLKSCIRRAVRSARSVIKSPAIKASKPETEIDVQEASVIVDEIPADHEPDVQEVNSAPVQEVNATTYEAMREAYEAYLDAEDKYLTSRKTDTAEKAKSDEAFRQYLTLLGRYRQGGMPEREEALSWIREYCEGKLFPVDSLKGRSFDELTELAHKCGLHEAFFKECDTRHDLAVKLIREAGIEDSEKTSYERKVEARKELQAEIHKLRQKRHALYKAQRVFGEGSADAEALSDVWDEYHDQADILLGEYWRVCEALALKRERICKYEADSQRADTLAMAEAVVSKELELQPAQIIKPKATISLKKKPHKISRKSHAPRWVQSLQVKSKASRHSPNSKPLMKATRAALSVRIKKF